MSGILPWLILAFAGAIHFVSAVPALPIPPPCRTSTAYKITLQTPVAGSPECVVNAGFVAPDPAGTYLSSSKDYEKSATVTGGISGSVDL